jgi:hypothetical protein
MQLLLSNDYQILLQARPIEIKQPCVHTVRRCVPAGRACFLFLDVHACIQPKPARACSMPLSPTNTNTAKIIRQPVIKRTTVLTIFFSLQVGRYRYIITRDQCTTKYYNVLVDRYRRTYGTHARELGTSLFSILGGSPSTSIGNSTCVNTLINRKKKKKRSSLPARYYYLSPSTKRR